MRPNARSAKNSHRQTGDEVGSHHLAIVPDRISNDLVRLKGAKSKSVHVRVAE